MFKFKFEFEFEFEFEFVGYVVYVLLDVVPDEVFVVDVVGYVV